MGDEIAILLLIFVKNFNKKFWIRNIQSFGAFPQFFKYFDAEDSEGGFSMDFNEYFGTKVHDNPNFGQV